MEGEINYDWPTVSYKEYGCGCCSCTYELTKEKLVEHIAEMKNELAKAEKLLAEWGNECS